MTIELVDPRGDDERPRRSLAPRVAEPSNLRTVGFLSNEDEHLTGPHFLGYTRILERELRQRLGIDQFRREVKPVLSRPADDAQLARLADCDAVINGLAK